MSLRLRIEAASPALMWPAFLLGGAAIGVTLGSIALWASHHGADAGDLLSLIGAAAGAGLAVWGALFVEDRKRTADSILRGSMLRESMVAALRAMKSTQVDDDAATPVVLLALSEAMIHTADMLISNTRALAPPTDFKMLATLLSVEQAIISAKMRLKIASDYLDRGTETRGGAARAIIHDTNNDVIGALQDSIRTLELLTARYDR